MLYLQFIEDALFLQEKDLSTLEFMGYTTGYRIIERLTREWPRFKDELDTMKFICTDFWSSIYRKQIDNLRTNHQGVYVLQDNAFRFLTRLSAGSQYLEHAPKVRVCLPMHRTSRLTRFVCLSLQFVAYTCGLVRGSLANLGITSTVTAEVQTMPSCKFHIQVNRT